MARSAFERPRLALAMRADLTPDLMGEQHWRRLERVVHILDRIPIEDFSQPRAHRLLQRADALLTGWGCPRIDVIVLERAARLRLIAHTGSSVKPIVSGALWSRDLAVISAAAANAASVAEFALAAILFANKRAFAARESYRTRREPVRYPWAAPGETGNFGAVVGIVGASRTGRQLMRLLRAFDLQILLYDPLVHSDEIEGARLAALDELVAACDVLSIHAPSLPQTRGMINARLLARLRNGATVVNTARGDIIDQAALERELVSGRIAAVLDVTDPEPLASSSKLFDLPNVFLTPHVAGAAGYETRRLADLAIDEIERFAAGNPLRHRVTREMLATIG